MKDGLSVNNQGPISLRPEHPQRRALSQLVTDFDLDLHGSSDGVEISGVSLSSGSVEPGDLYIGMPGVRTHGAAYAAQAAERGAVAVLTDADGLDLATAAGLPIIVVPEPRAALGHLAAWVYRTAEEPPTLFGVTGTNGKTSVVYLLSGMLAQLGIVSGLSSTAERRIGDLAVTSSLTTPEASELHALLARMRESEVRAVAIEVSAQALTRHRVDGIVFDVVGFTNLSHDHFDDYGDFDEYFAAKRELFEPDRARRGVVTVDSEWGGRLVEQSRIPVTTLTARPEVDADWRMTILEEAAGSTTFRLEGPEDRTLVTSVPLLGWFMAANAALAIVMLVESGVEFDMIAGARRRHRRLHPRAGRAHQRRSRARRVHRLRTQPGRLPQHPRGDPSRHARTRVHGVRRRRRPRHDEAPRHGRDRGPRCRCRGRHRLPSAERRPGGHPAGAPGGRPTASCTRWPTRRPRSVRRSRWPGRATRSSTPDQGTRTTTRSPA
jgi:UDP-N-acetylmuramoyl-L-alanyl-D-glutamate--2,6-diaminopimelate ligase